MRGVRRSCGLRPTPVRFSRRHPLPGYGGNCATETVYRAKNSSPPPSESQKAHGLFHWELSFPHVFERGGFDVVLGNPPWERLKLQEQEFFAKRETVDHRGTETQQRGRG